MEQATPSSASFAFAFRSANGRPVFLLGRHEAGRLGNAQGTQSTRSCHSVPALHRSGVSGHACPLGAGRGPAYFRGRYSRNGTVRISCPALTSQTLLGAMQPIKNVAILGADGKLGPAVLEALVSASFTVTVLKRESSKSSNDHYPPSVKVARVPNDLNVESLATTLQGHDALVITIKGSQTEVQKKLADAAVQAGVRRMIPADFGSCDSSTTEAQELVPLFKHKADLRQYLQTLAAQHQGFTWTSLVTGHFFDCRCA
ncbi:hypothetical protein KC360_g125 [Hortaea werneckii]|nr:hypothetical protein KC360_g125 [Hortaea werneckii]